MKSWKLIHRHSSKLAKHLPGGRAPKKKTHLPTLVFQVPAVSLRESGNFWSTQSPMRHLKIWLDHPRCTDSSRSDQHNLPNAFERKKKRAQKGFLFTGWWCSTPISLMIKGEVYIYIYTNNMYIISILTDIIGAASGPPPTVLKLGNDSSMLLR